MIADDDYEVLVTAVNQLRRLASRTPVVADERARVEKIIVENADVVLDLLARLLDEVRADWCVTRDLRTAFSAPGVAHGNSYKPAYDLARLLTGVSPDTKDSML